jgi:hypothetical protein
MNNEKISDFSRAPNNQEVKEISQKEGKEIEFGRIRSEKEVAEAQKKLAELIAATKKSIEEEYKKEEKGPAQ